MRILDKAIDGLARWKRDRGTRGRCLEATWHVTFVAGLPCPGGKTAYDSWLRMAKNPGYYGYEAVTHDKDGNLPEPCLVYFKSKWYQGRPFSPRPGHIGILKNGKIYSDVDYPLKNYRNRMVGAYIPTHGR